MKRKRSVLSKGVLLFLLSTGFSIAGQLSVIENGKSDYSIIVSKDAGNPEREKLVLRAANLLQETLTKATGVTLPIVPEGKAGGAKPGIYLGQTDAAKKAGLPLEKIEGWTFLKQVAGNDLFLVGYDGESAIKDEDSKTFAYQGTLKAVTSFLQDAGVSFLLPGPNGTDIPKLAKLEVDDSLKSLQEPKFYYIIGRNTGDETYAIANNYLRSSLVKSFGGHSYYMAVPAAKYAKTHPEYFILKNGVRSPSGNHLCISNPEVRELMLTEMEKWLDAGYRWVELAETDGYTPCECNECKAIHPDIKERTWIFHRQLAEEMKKRRPGKKVMIISYGKATKEPPTSFSDFPDNVVIQLSSYSPDALAQWARFGVETTAYVYNWGVYQTPGFGPKRTPKYAAEQVRQFHDEKVRGIYLCGAFENIGLEGPVYYVYGQALGDPDLNWRGAADRFYNAAYGKAAAPMKAFFETLYEQLEAYCGVNRPNGSNAAVSEISRVAFNTPEKFYCTVFSPPVLLDMAKNLDRAKSIGSDPAIQARIRLVEREFSYVRNLAEMYTHYRSYRLQPNYRTFEPVARAVEERNKLIDSWYDETGKMRAVDGWPRFFDNAPKALLATGGRLSAPLGSPATWNIEQFRKANFLPGATQRGKQESKRIKAARIDSAPGGKIPPFAWNAVEPQTFVAIDFKESKNATRVRVAYDDEALYLDFDCALEEAGKLKPVARGKDGKVWQSECIEIFLDPTGKRQSYLHLIFNPVTQSFYDARYGFITDDLNPLFGQEDASWDAKWDYSAVIDPAGKRWTAQVRIPFSAIKAAPPEPGTAWLAKFARAEFPITEGHERGVPIYSCWPSSLDSNGFGDPSTFGELVFESRSTANNP